MARWFRPLAAVFSVLVALAVGVSVPGAAQSPEARPGQPGWSRAASLCFVWNGEPKPGETVHWAGVCENGRASGPGELSWHYDGKTELYEGEMRDGKRHGRGTYVWANGDRYEGEYRDGHEHGRGTFVWANGDRYDGEWRNGNRHGYGTVVTANGGRFDGEWLDDNRDGRGTMVWASGSRYDGEWRDDKQHGRGTYVWASGNRYDGEWRNGKQHGRGTWAGENGDRYDGEWREGLADGIGDYSSAGDGETYSGLWHGGCFRDGGRRAAVGVPMTSCP